ncbi:unnamed protein product [Ilex paraguariensis]|uniref:Uncharacterized protein n=2 Tax=Ilex paraguariensis TaxID=185542 RepID=A0ABC8SVF0_9AQUA
MLEEYTILRQEKEEEHKRQRDQKKLQGQLIAEQEALFGSKPSPMKNQSGKRGPRLSCGGASNEMLSLGGPRLQTLKPDLLHSTRAIPNTHKSRKNARLHQNDQFNHPRDNGVAPLSAGRKGLDIAGLPAKKHHSNAVNARGVESHMLRQPFSPIYSTDSSKSNTTNILKGLNRKQKEMLQKTLTNEITPCTTPFKIISAADEENRTPKTMSIPLPSTPSTVSVSMQTTMTPAPPVIYSAHPVEDIDAEIEYSFEERRAGFVLPKTHLRTIIQD